MSASPIVLYGSLRAGTTMFRLMLDGHPHLDAPGESDFMFDYIRQTERGWACDLEEMGQDRVFRMNGWALPRTTNGADAIGQLVGQVAGFGRRPVLIVHRNLEKVAALLPNAHVIHLKRDPRDVARSSIGMGWAGNVWHGADHWLETEKSWRAGVGQLHNAPLELRFEDLLAHPENQLRRVCSYLETDFFGSMLTYANSSSYAAPDPSLAYQWHRKLSDYEIQLIEARLGVYLPEHGYATSGLTPLKVGPFARAQLGIQNKLAKFRFAAKRYGLALILRHRIAGGLNISPWHRRMQIEIDEIKASGLK